MKSKINRITDILRRDDGISGAMMYTEQISWILFLKFLNDLEELKNEVAEFIMPLKSKIDIQEDLYKALEIFDKDIKWKQ